MPPWHCSGLAPGRSMRAFLDGSASTFETERVRSPTTFELVPTHCKWPFLPSRYGVHGDSIWGCALTGPAPQSPPRTKDSDNDEQ